VNTFKQSTPCTPIACRPLSNKNKYIKTACATKATMKEEYVTKAKAQAACYLPLLESASPTPVITYNKETKEFVPSGNKATWEHFQTIHSKG
jgi:hypothetical protein